MATSAQLRKQILQGSWDAALAALYGADPAVLQRQRGRYAAALEQFELYFGPGRQVQVYSAPGRAELGGRAAGRGEYPLGQPDPRHCRGFPCGG